MVGVILAPVWTIVTFTWKRLMGWILRLQKSHVMLYIAVTVLTRRIHICKNYLCGILDELCHVYWSCIYSLNITSYFPIKFSLSRFGSFFLQWFFPQPRMKNLASVFQRFLLLLPGFLLILPVFSLIFFSNISIPKIPSPIFLSSSKSPFTSSQLNNFCDNLRCISFAPCAYLWKHSLKLHRSHPHTTSSPSFTHDWCPHSPKILFAAPSSCFSHSWHLG